MSTTIDNGGPAFPHATAGEYSDLQTCRQWHPYLGMTLRDYFAGQAMQGMLAAGEGPWQPKNDEQLSAWAYKTADAMLQARKINTTSK